MNSEDRNLFQVTGTLHHQDYPDTQWTTKKTRLVWARDEAEARQKFEAAYARDDQYGHNIWVSIDSVEKPIE